MDQQLEQRVRARQWFERFPRMIPIGMFGMAMLVSLISVYSIDRLERERHRFELEARTNRLATALQKRLALHGAYLRAAAIIISRGRQTDRLALLRFMQALQFDENYKGSVGVAYAPLVSTPAPSGKRAMISGKGHASYAVWPKPSERAQMAPVNFIYPEPIGQRPVLGFDLLSEPTRRAAIMEAIRRRQPVASAQLALMQDASSSQARAGQGQAFILFCPVFAPNGVSVQGVFSIGFRAKELLASLDDGRRGSAQTLRLYDGTPEAQNLLATASHAPDGATPADSATSQFVAANRLWTLVVSMPSTHRLSELSMVMLLAGFVVATLMMLIGRLLCRHAEEDRRLLEWQISRAQIRETLSRELNHRVKNTLANVLSIAALTRRRANNIDEFYTGLAGRVRSLSATHDLLTASEWGQTAIGDLFAVELAPYLQEQGVQQITMSGPEILIAPNDALNVGMAVHELVTNAAKFGALSVLEGRVAISWKLITPEMGEFFWQESGGPPVTPPTQTGFGIDLLTRIAASELKEPVELRFLPEGLTYRLCFAVRGRKEFKVRA